MAELTDKRIRRVAGTTADVAFEAASGADIFRIGPTCLLLIQNTGAQTRTVTIPPGFFSVIRPAGTRGVSVPTLAVDVPAGERKAVFVPYQYGDANGNGTVEAANPADIEYAVLNVEGA